MPESKTDTIPTPESVLRLNREPKHESPFSHGSNTSLETSGQILAAAGKMEEFTTRLVKKRADNLVQRTREACQEGYKRAVNWALPVVFTTSALLVGCDHETSSPVPETPVTAPAEGGIVGQYLKEKLPVRKEEEIEVYHLLEDRFGLSFGDVEREGEKEGQRNGHILVLRIWSKNNYSGPIPPELGKLRKLEKLSFLGGVFTGQLPSELGDLEDLKELTFSNCENLSGPIPPELGKLRKLEKLYIIGGGLVGSLPRGLRAREVSIENSKIDDIPIELVGQLTSLNIKNSELSKRLGPNGVKFLRKKYPDLILITEF